MAGIPLTRLEARMASAEAVESLALTAASAGEVVGVGDAVVGAGVAGDVAAGASASDGLIGDLAGAWPGIPGGTTLIGMARGQRMATHTMIPGMTSRPTSRMQRLIMTTTRRPAT